MFGFIAVVGICGVALLISLLFAVACVGIAALFESGSILATALALFGAFIAGVVWRVTFVSFVLYCVVYVVYYFAYGHQLLIG